MTKLVCLDYAGVILQLKGDDLKKIYSVIAENSRLKNTEEAADWLEHNWGEVEMDHEGSDDTTENDIFEKILQKADTEIGLRYDHSVLATLLSNYKMYGPIGADVEEFIRLCPYPVYITAMNSVNYVNVCLRRNRLHVYGVISAEQKGLSYSTASVLEEAQRQFGCEKEEILYVGRHPKRDIVSASNFGVNAVLLDRRSRYRGCDCRRVRSLIELLPGLQKDADAASQG